MPIDSRGEREKRGKRGKGGEKEALWSCVVSAGLLYLLILPGKERKKGRKKEKTRDGADGRPHGLTCCNLVAGREKKKRKEGKKEEKGKKKGGEGGDREEATNALHKRWSYTFSLFTFPLFEEGGEEEKKGKKGGKGKGKG